jgi:hypothetical protein
VAPAHAEICLENLANGAALSGTERLAGTVFPGTYQLKVRENGITIESRTLTIQPGEEVDLDLLAPPQSPVQEQLLQAIPGNHNRRLADFSESLGGPMANWDFGLWLSLLGASRIVGGASDFSKLGPLPLESFDDITQDESVVYVLAGFEKTTGQFNVALSTTADVTWRPMHQPSGLRGIYECRLPAVSGFHLLSFQMPGQAPLTFATYCLPNRATLLTVAEDAQGRLTVHQYMLPIHRVFQGLDLKDPVRQYLQPFIVNPLEAVRTMALAQSQFARNRPIDRLGGGEEWTNWLELIEGKWLDPLMSAIAAYEIIRRGYFRDRISIMQEMTQNLRKYFHGIPDIEVIAKLIGLDWEKPKVPPLLLDGLLAVEELEDVLPLPPDKLDYKSPWVVWRGAVSA